MVGGACGREDVMMGFGRVWTDKNVLREGCALCACCLRLGGIWYNYLWIACTTNYVGAFALVDVGVLVMDCCFRWDRWSDGRFMWSESEACIIGHSFPKQHIDDRIFIMFINKAARHCWTLIKPSITGINLWFWRVFYTSNFCPKLLVLPMLVQQISCFFIQ